MQDQTYIFSSKHARLDRYNIVRGEIIVHEYRGKFSASHPVFGAGKEYATPEAAIVCMLADHSCTVTVHGPKAKIRSATPRTDALIAARVKRKVGKDAAVDLARNLERELAATDKEFSLAVDGWKRERERAAALRTALEGLLARFPAGDTGDDPRWADVRAARAAVKL